MSLWTRTCTGRTSTAGDHGDAGSHTPTSVALARRGAYVQHLTEHR